jgi:hypothetical protein
LFITAMRVAEAERLHLVVGDVDGGGLELRDQLLELRAEGEPQQRVQVGERLVHQQHGRLHHDRAGDRDPLALPAGQLRRVAAQQLAELDQVGGPLHPLPHPGPVDLAHAQAEGDVVEHGQVREDRVALEHHRQVALARRQVGDVGVADAHPAAVGVLQAGQQPQQRRLAAAAGPQQHHELAVGDLQVDIVDGGGLVEDLAHALQADLGHGPAPSSSEPRGPKGRAGNGG